ncbi:MAG: YciI family protein [Acidobacteriota bacterium]
MKYMMMAKSSPKNEGQPPTPEMMEAMGKFIEKGAKTGKLVSLGGLLPSKFGAQVHLKNGKITVTDGPFTEAKELIGGFAIMECASKEEAIQMASDFLQVHIGVMGDDFEMTSEVRPMSDN